jgi:hypothetical protein
MKTLVAILILTASSLSFAKLPEDYQTLTAGEKQQKLWEELDSNYPDVLPGFAKRLFLQAVGTRAMLSLKKTMTHTSDEMPEGRVKFIHTYGSCAQAEFQITHQNPYTGLFQSGAPAIIRIGWGAPPELVGHIPGMAVKLLVDGLPSKNLHVMNSLDGQGSNKNFFQNSFSNIIDEPKNSVLRLLAQAFKIASTNPFELPLNHLAAVDSKGYPAPTAKAPRQIIFQPTQEVQMLTEYKIDLREALSKPPFDAETVLYNIYAAGEGLAPLVSPPILIGQLILKSKFFSNEYCDKKLFFQHNDTFLKKP